MNKKDNPNVIPAENMSDEDKRLLISDKKIYAKEGMECPQCGLDTIEEQNVGGERISFCTHCDYFASKNIL